MRTEMSFSSCALILVCYFYIFNRLYDIFIVQS